MGNCLRYQSSMTWAGNDLESKSSNMIFEHDTHDGICHDRVQNDMEMEEERSISKNKTVSSTEVKIKVTKRQLEELLARFDIQGMSVEQVLTQLMNGGGDCHARHQSWRPTLQSIPEVN
ncbi:uncharacterized protein LOC131243986 [Magnolia sinica]|uniref:uncharacterized protein LOC131243986 n=1 Tax=Magnolia sinica TaxID=86752 RepID=UPI00265B6894|nr:uncharacterized protein LOC131243986 [Magnolia sinica]